MKWIRIFRVHFLRSLRTPWTFFFIVLAAAIALAAGLQPGSGDSNRFAVAVVCEDEGSYGSRLYAALADYNQLDLRLMSRQDALSLLRQDRLEAVFIIRKNYTANLRTGNFKDIIDWYTAPSSRAAASVSEPLINSTMQFWLEEQVIANTRNYLQEQGLSYTAADEQIQRDLIQEVWKTGASVHIDSTRLAAAGSSAADPVPPAQADALATCVRWYAVFSVFYLVVSATWVLDINKRGLRVRTAQSGTRLWQLLLGTSLAPLLIGLAGYWLVGAVCCLAAGSSWLRLIVLSLPVMVYLWTVLGMTIALASMLRQALALLFLAPLTTFIQAILSGLIAALPDWANVLTAISRGLPGRWLLLSLNSPLGTLPAALLCCLAWLAGGILLSEAQQAKHRSGS
jgi:hypothetical protein